MKRILIIKIIILIILRVYIHKYYCFIDIIILKEDNFILGINYKIYARSIIILSLVINVEIIVSLQE